MLLKQPREKAVRNCPEILFRHRCLMKLNLDYLLICTFWLRNARQIWYRSKPFKPSCISTFIEFTIALYAKIHLVYLTLHPALHLHRVSYAIPYTLHRRYIEVDCVVSIRIYFIHCLACASTYRTAVHNASTACRCTT